MKRLLGVCVGTLLLSAMPAFAQATKPAEQKAAPAAGKAMTAMGTVSAVTADSLTVKGKTEEWTFSVDAKTVVNAKGASHKTAAMKAEGKPTQITDFVHVGDSVSVRYHDMGTTKHAASVTVRTAAAPAKK